MIAPVPATPADIVPAAKPEGGRAAAGDLFAAILGSRTVTPAAGNDAGEQDASAPSGSEKVPDDGALDAVLALIAQAVGVPVPVPTAAAGESPCSPAKAGAQPGDIATGPRPSPGSMIAATLPQIQTPPVALDGDAAATGKPADATPAADIATLLRRIREWAEAPAATAADPAKPDAAPHRAAGSAADAPALPVSAAPAAPLPAFAAPAVQQPSSDPAATADPAESAAGLIERHLDVAKDGAWLDRLARDIAMSAGHSSRMKFQLNPEHLGSLHVEIAQGAEGATIRLTAETETARAILVGAEPRLAAEARAQGLRIADARIDLGNQGAGGQGAQQQARPQVRTASPLSEHPLAVVERTMRAAERFA